MDTAIIAFLALSFGVCLGYVLCSVMMVSSAEQRRAAHAKIPEASPLQPESLPYPASAPTGFTDR